MNKIKEKILNWTMTAITIALCLAGIVFTAKAHSVHPIFVNEALTNSQINEYMDKTELHEMKGRACYFKAQSMVWYLPQSSDKEKAQWCFMSAMASCAPGTPQSKFIAATICMLSIYGLQCLEEYEKIDSLLKEAEYHFEMLEFYEQVLILG